MPSTCKPRLGVHVLVTERFDGDDEAADERERGGSGGRGAGDTLRGSVGGGDDGSRGRGDGGSTERREDIRDGEGMATSAAAGTSAVASTTASAS
jgi:hypothetical protein